MSRFTLLGELQRYADRDAYGDRNILRLYKLLDYMV